MLIKSNMIYGKVYQKTTFGELAYMAAVWLFQGVENRVGKLFSENSPKKATENQQSTFHPFFSRQPCYVRAMYQFDGGTLQEFHNVFCVVLPLSLYLICSMGNRWLEIVTIDSTKLALWKLRRRRARRPLVREDFVSCLEIRMGEFIAKVVQFMGKLLLSSVTRMDFFGENTRFIEEGKIM